MLRNFPLILSALRRERKINQRKAAADLGISQALLSHYENGVREPGLNFICRACDYYGVTADFILGRCEERNADKTAQDGINSLTGHLRRLVDDFGTVSGK